MSATFRPRLVNGRFGDPALFIELAHERNALMLDLGDIHRLSARDLLRVTAVGVSHMHVDHLIGFDALLRVNVGREAHIALVGPAGLAERIGCKLLGYTWDLVDRYSTELTFEVAELIAPDKLRKSRFRMSTGFRPEGLGEAEIADGVVLQTDRWTMSAEILEHHGPCLGFAIAEPRRINVWRNRVEQLGQPVGPWLKDLKDAVREDAPDSTSIALPDGSHAPLSHLRHLVSVEQGEKIGYVTDIRDTPENRAAVKHLCVGAATLFIEASFAAADADKAAERAHLTTRAAGEIARACEARRVEPFHFSPRYEGEEEARLAEVQAAFGADRRSSLAEGK